MIKKIIANSLLIILLVFALVLMVLPIFGYKSYVVDSSSMHPTIPKYSLVYVKVLSEQEKNDLLPGEIVAIKNESKPFLHRIVDKNGNMIQTQGDANDEPDAWISVDRVIGVEVFFIPWLGLLFSSVYPWLIMVSSVLIYILTKQLVKEFKKK
jgi:signal peptidase I